MGLSKHLVPVNTRHEIINFINTTLPEGFIRQNLANGETIGGLALVGAGAIVDGKVGLLMRYAGELLDDIDGDTARALGIESRLGALLDPVADKLKMALELWTLWKHTAEFESDEQTKRRLALGIIGGKHILNATLNTTSFVLGLQPESSNIGKINLWVDGVAVAAFGIADVIENPVWNERFANFGYFATAVGIPTGVITTAGYANDLIQGIHEKFSLTAPE